MGITKVDTNTADDITYSILNGRLFEEEEGIHELLNNTYLMYRIKYEYILKLIRESEQMLYDLLVADEQRSVDWEIATITGNEEMLEELRDDNLGQALEDEMFKYDELKGLLYKTVREIKGKIDEPDWLKD